MPDMADPLLLSAVVKYAGVLIALAGIMLTTPDGIRKLTQSLRQGLSRRIEPARRLLARVLPPLRRSVNVAATTVAATATIGRVTVSITGFRWDPEAPVDERINTLRGYIADLEKRHNQLAGQLPNEVAKLEEAITAVREDLTSAITALRDFLEEKDEKAASLDGRGVPVIVIGLLMTNLPQEIASLPWGLGWVISAITSVLTAWIALTVLREHRATRALAATATA